MQKGRRVIHDQPLSSCSSASGNLLSEIFSICIGGITEEVHALYGTIMVKYGFANSYHIFNKDESCFELLENNNIVSTEGPDHVIPNCEFYLDLNLKDPVQDLELNRGEFGWNIAQLERYDIFGFDKPMCLVVRGKDGFAVVHYMIFSHAMKAHVEVRLFFNSAVSDPANVYGHLVAYYCDFDYSKRYQRKCYQSRLFDLPQNKSVELLTGSKLTLSRSVVAVPTFSSLFIEADLDVCGLTGICNSKKGFVFGRVEFEIDMSCT